jgi:hypothetical protein
MPIRFASYAPESDDAEPFRFVDAWQAYIACRRGKRRSASAQRYAVGVFDRLTDTVDALASGMWKPSAAQSFVVTRPKAREVLAAAFGDRIVHHLLTPRLERQYEPVFIFDAWSNRTGKGIHAAVARLRGFMQGISDNGAKCGAPCGSGFCGSCLCGSGLCGSGLAREVFVTARAHPSADSRAPSGRGRRAADLRRCSGRWRAGLPPGARHDRGNRFATRGFRFARRQD